jgi:hypothetical protein
LVGQIPDQSAFPEFLIPDLRAVTADVPAGGGRLFVGLPGNEGLPGAAILRDRDEEVATPDRVQKGSHPGGEPAPLFLIRVRQAGVLFAVVLVGAPEVDRPPHRPDAGVVVEDVVLILRPEAADHRDAAGRKLRKRIADAFQDPEFRWIEAGVVWK